MIGPEFRAIRSKLDLSHYEWGRAFGWRGNRNTLRVQICQYESGHREIPPWIERLAEMYGRCDDSFESRVCSRFELTAAARASQGNLSRSMHCDIHDNATDKDTGAIVPHPRHFIDPRPEEELG